MDIPSKMDIVTDFTIEKEHAPLPKLLGRVFMVLFAGMFITACGGDYDGDELSGRIQIDGSSTVYPLTEAVAEEFMAEYPRVRVTVGVSGTGGGFSKFARGETDISNASRPIAESEIELARSNGIEFIEVPVAYDGLAVMVHPENDWVDCLTVEELRRIWEPGSDINNWNQVRDDFPDHGLQLYAPGTDSGTYDYFTEAINGESGASRADFMASEDDNVIVQGIAGDPEALGYFGLSYYSNNQDRLKLIGIDDENPENGEGCIQPTAETVQGGTYQPLTRPEFIYIRADRAEAPEIEEFVRFYVDNVDELAREVDYVPLSPEAYELGWERFEQRITGSVFEEAHGAQIGVSMQDLLKQSRPAGSPQDVDTSMVDTTGTD